MIPELGHFAMILALALALVQGVVPLAGSLRGWSNWTAVARPAVAGQFLFLAIAFGALAYCFLSNDFSVRYVAGNSNTQLPAIYRFAAVWGGHEGSLLLWALTLSGWSVAVAAFSRPLPTVMSARVLAVMGLVSVGFLAFIILTSNPFERLFPTPMDGRDLNPLLQDPGLVFHPPLLYMGYVGFSVAFAFAIAAMIGGKLDATWARWSRPWTVVAWIFLTLGITLGSWWAYYELGWGGWWFWDPVENASFMPWLVGTALIHSLAVTEKRGAFRNWTVLLAVFAFSLSLLGTFLVRSGVLTSVHAFAADPSRGIFILGLLAVVVGVSLTLFAFRAPRMAGGGKFNLASREAALLANNVVLVVAAASVLLGTLYPLILQALDLGKLSVGPPYFESVFVPLMIPLLLLLGFGPQLRWKRDTLGRLGRGVVVALAVAAVLGGALAWAAGERWSIMVAVGLTLAVWIVLGGARDLRAHLRNKASLVDGLKGLSPSFWGMLLAHAGVAAFIVGVTVTSAFSVEKDLRATPGKSVEVAGHRFEFVGVRQTPGPNYTAHEGLFRIFKGDDEVADLTPQKRLYNVQRMPMTEAAIDWGLTRDLYVALGEPLPNGDWAVRVYYKPYVRWIWLGAVLMALGGLVAILDRRYRLIKQAAA
ncbi:heme lyase CcmF/NrfE family subunit [Endothiovibrio diazotrophicus]